MLHKINSKEEIEEYVNHVYREGYNRGLSTGMEQLDKHYTYRKGELDVITGFANIGKTTAIFYLMMIASVRYKWKWLCYCPENEPVGDMIIDLAEMFIGMTADKTKNERMDRTVFDAACAWVMEHFKVLSFPKTPNIYDVLSVFEEELSAYPYDGCYVDPMNDLSIDRTMSKYDYYYQVLSDIRRFKQKHHIKFILVTHAVTKAAREKGEDGNTPAPSHYDVEMGGMFANRTDNFLVVHRNPNSENWSDTEIHVRKIKFQKLVGIPTQENEPVILRFEPRICRFKSLNKTKMAWEDILARNSEEFVHSVVDRQKTPSMFNEDEPPF
tara:strand:- start:3089 stop:4066 length:978 start_codon:yes stop_codon:yes gene_type:complete